MPSDLRKALEDEFNLGRKAAIEEYEEQAAYAYKQSEYSLNRAMQQINDVDDLKDFIFDLATTSANLLVGGPQNNDCLIAIDRIMRSVLWGELGRKLHTGEYSDPNS